MKILLIIVLVLCGVTHANENFVAPPIEIQHALLQYFLNNPIAFDRLCVGVIDPNGQMEITGWHRVAEFDLKTLANANKQFAESRSLKDGSMDRFQTISKCMVINESPQPPASVNLSNLESQQFLLTTFGLRSISESQASLYAINYSKGAIATAFWELTYQSNMWKVQSVKTEWHFCG